MGLINHLKRIYWKFRLIKGKFISFISLCTKSHSYYPEKEQKSKSKQFLELLYWLLRYHEINHYYFVYGLDVKGSPLKRYMPFNAFCKARNARNEKPHSMFNFYEDRHNYLCLMRDKFLFGQYLMSLSFPTPRNIAILTENNILLGHGQTSDHIDNLLDVIENTSCFCKPLDGILGQDAFPLEIRNKQLINSDTTVALLKTKLKGKRYLLQERVVQHDKMQQLYPHAINTLRIVTVQKAHKIEILCSALRVGANGIHTDNWGSGGIILRVDPTKGIVIGDGFFKPGKGLRVSKHPDTHIILDGFHIPHFNQALDLVKSCHQYFYGLHSIGWDIAITPDGPTIIEGNDDWDGIIPMTLEPEFKKEFEAAFKIQK